MGPSAAGAKDVDPTTAGGFYPDGSCPVMGDDRRA
jgi:hypothetical protein